MIAGIKGGVFLEALTEKEDLIVDELQSLHGRFETNREHIAALGSRIDEEKEKAERPKRNARSTKNDDWVYW